MLTKNPKDRPTAEDLIFIMETYSLTQIISLYDNITSNCIRS